jgi:hypothetical protein
VALGGFAAYVILMFTIRNRPAPSRGEMNSGILDRIAAIVLTVGITIALTRRRSDLR